MSQGNSTKYHRLTQEQRVIIQNRLENQESKAAIAKTIGCNRSTIYREIKRNSIPDKNHTTRVNQPTLALVDTRNHRGSILGDKIKQARYNYQNRLREFEKNKPRYIAEEAQRKANERIKVKQKPLLLRPEYADTVEYIEDKLSRRWSPEQISGRMALEGKLPLVSYLTIYHYIYSQEDKEKRGKLVHCLRRKGRPYRIRKRMVYNQTNRDKHSIHDRPEEVDKLMRIGDLEGDTIVGSDPRDRILTHNDRLAGIISMGLVIGFNSEKIARQAKEDITRVFCIGEWVAITITYDNGVEFTLWRRIEELTDTTIYFSDPYTPGQRGRNENLNGLVRDFLPKGTDFKKLTKSDILEIESLLNNRPRKRFNYLTPLEYREKLSVALEG